MDSEPPPLLGLLLLQSSQSSVAVPIFILLLLIFGSALISASEVAFFSLSSADIDELDKEGGTANKRIIKLKNKPRHLLVAILVANNFINIGIVILSYFILNQLISQSTFLAWATWVTELPGINFISISACAKTLSFLLTTVTVTFILVLFGEVAPKIYANLHNRRHARLMAGPLSLLTTFLGPISGLLVNWSGGIEERFYRNKLSKSTDKKELDKAIELSVNEAESKEDVDILKGIIKFGDVEAKQIMKPRVDVVSIDHQANFIEVMNVVKESGYSRIPIFEDDFDNIKGILYVKDLLGHTHQGASFKWKDLIRNQVIYVPEAKKIDQLLKVFQQKRTHMAVVVDEYGGSSGIITLEDIMEEVVGDIKDEFDLENEVDFVKIDDKNYVFEGKTLLNDVGRVIGIDPAIFDEGKGVADSLAGLIIEIEGRIPTRDREISYSNLKFKIVSVSKKRIEKINVCL